MTARPARRYVVRGARGEELVCPSLSDLHALYAQGFLSDDDLVRPESGGAWVPVRSMPALRGVRERRRDPKKTTLLFVAVLLLVTALALLVRGPGRPGRSPAPASPSGEPGAAPRTGPGVSR